MACVSATETLFDYFTRIWTAAKRAPEGLPFFEEVAIGELGEAAAKTALFQRQGGDWRVLRKGAGLESWLSAERLQMLDPDADLETEALASALERASLTQRPERMSIPALVDGRLEQIDTLSLPLATRWGLDLTMLVAETGAGLNVGEILTHSCKEGLLAVAQWPGVEIDFRVVGANRAALDLFALSGEPVHGARLSQLLKANAGRQEILAELAVCARERRARTFLASFFIGARRFDIQVSASPADGLMAIALTDVGEIKRREDSFRLLFEANPLPMTICDCATLDLTAVNVAARRLCEPKSGASGNLRDIWPDASHDELRKLAEGAGARPLSLRQPDGSELHVLAYGRNLPADNRERWLLAFVDVTERKRAEQKIERLAHHDPLTGLLNRTAFMTGLERALAEAPKENVLLAVALIDLDHFKEVNDTLGHPVGDRVLCEVAARLKTRLAQRQVVARLGGDEFAIAFHGQSSIKPLAEFCAEIVADLSEPYFIEGEAIELGASVGMAVWPLHGEDPTRLLKHADLALYQAKAAGRGRVGVFSKELEERILKRREMGTALRRAIDGGEFVLHYQPMVRIADGRLKSFEALVRWERPGIGLAPPAEFIRLAEELGHICDIGDWVLYQACREAARWPDDISVSVNVSPAQFRGSRLQRTVARALAESGLAPWRLELEITENVLLADSEANIGALKTIRAMGVRIAMDDFGTGFSSLSYLRRFPFDKIKIDQSFVRDAAENIDSIAIIRAVTGLGANLGINVTAEGVETAEQLELLRKEGCPEAQGYYFSRPMPANLIGAFLSSRAAAPFPEAGAAQKVA